MTSQNVALPEGYYAVIDPVDSGLVTYWRVRGDDVTAWPSKARYGPRLVRSDVPEGLSGPDRQAWVWGWAETVYHPYHAEVRARIASDPTGAGARFASLMTRCCNCGRPLTDAESKVYGIGPECRRGLPAEWLDAMAHAVGRAHAAAGGAA